MPSVPIDRDAPPAPPATLLTQALIDLRAQRKAAIARHEEELRDLDSAIEHTERERQFVVGGMQLEAVKLAETVLYVEGPGNRNRGDGQGAIAAAIADLASGTPKLRTTAFSTKHYDRWDGQREDHSYGYGPKHGTTIFEIGLREEARDRDLTPEETEAAIHYLLTLRADR